MAYALPAIFALFVWWFSTGAIIWLDGLPKHTFKWSMAGATMLALAGFYGLHLSAGGTELADAYIAFASVMAVWAWLWPKWRWPVRLVRRSPMSRATIPS